MGKTSPTEPIFGEVFGKDRFCHRFSGDFGTSHAYKIFETGELSFEVSALLKSL